MPYWAPTQILSIIFYLCSLLASKSLNNSALHMPTKRNIILGTMSILMLWILFFAYQYNRTYTTPMENKTCFNEENFLQAYSELEKWGNMQIEDFTIRIFEGKIVFDGKKWETLGSISKEKWITPMVISWYDGCLLGWIGRFVIF